MRRVAAAIVVAQTVAELVYVSSRHELVVGLRVFLGCVLVLQIVFAQGVLRFSAGSVFGLLVFEAVAVVAAAVGSGPAPVRGLLGLSAAAVVVLVLRSLPEFPPATLPRSPSRT